MLNLLLISFLFSDLKNSEKISSLKIETEKKEISYSYKFQDFKIYNDLLNRVDKVIEEEKDKEFLVFLDKDLLPIMNKEDKQQWKQ